MPVRGIAPLLSSGALLALLLGLATPQASAAQHLETSLSRGLRIRVLAPAVAGNRLAGRVEAVSSDSLALVHRDTTLWISWASVQALDVSRGKRRALGALQGAGVGALIGGITMACVAAASHDPEHSEWTRGADAAIGFAVGGLMGAWSGAAVGVMVGRERWERIPVPGHR